MAGLEFVQAFTKQEGLKSADKQAFLDKLGLKAEPQGNGVEGFEQSATRARFALDHGR